MIIQSIFPISCKRPSVWFAVLAVITLLAGCGGGSSSSGVGAAGNQNPTATISEPTGTYFKEGENITFSGIATDAQGSQLDGAALVWTSSIDGDIGTGSTLITSVLSAGDHDITLSATDSGGSTTTTAPLSIHVEQTRFIKMGSQTSTSITDAANAFDGYSGTAATISGTETEYIYFKSYIGGSDTFFFGIKVGGSTPGSRITIQGLNTNGTWQPLNEIILDVDKTVTVKETDPQAYKDNDGYINLRMRWEGGGSGDSVPIYEIWRTDPAYAGPQTQSGVIDPDAAFDGSTDTASSAKIVNPWGGNNVYDYLQIKAYVGQSETLTLNMLLNIISKDQVMAIDVETSPNVWELLEALPLDSTDTRIITVPNAQEYIDTDGYISLRARWIGYGSSNQLEIYEIWRRDTFFVGPQTPAIYVNSPESVVDGNLDSFAIIYYFWGESNRHDFLHVETYLGDVSNFEFGIHTGMSAQGSDSQLIIEGEQKPDSWAVIERITLADPTTTIIRLPNAREFINSDGYLSMRMRWESDSPNHDAYIYEIWR